VNTTAQIIQLPVSTTIAVAAHPEHVCFDHAKDERCTICGGVVITKPGKKLEESQVLSSHTVPRWKLIALVICPPLARWLLPGYSYLSWWRRALVRRALRWEVAGFHRWGKVAWRIAQVYADGDLQQALFAYAGRMLVMGG
jgi:hypothetical protein